MIDAARERGVPLKGAITEAPELDFFQARVIRAFEELSSCRQIAMGTVGPIPWVAIDAFADRLGLVEDEIAYADFMYLIRELDEVFLRDKRAEIDREKRKLEANRGKSPGVRPSHVRARRGR